MQGDIRSLRQVDFQLQWQVHCVTICVMCAMTNVQLQVHCVTICALSNSCVHFVLRNFFNWDVCSLSFYTYLDLTFIQVVHSKYYYINLRLLHIKLNDIVCHQVNFEFDTDEDLLAVDSSLSNEVSNIDWTPYFTEAFIITFCVEFR